MIRTALQWAVKHRYIRENVADFAEKPSHVRYRGAEPYTVQEIANPLQLTASQRADCRTDFPGELLWPPAF